MKKLHLIFALIALLLVFSLTACSGGLMDGGTEDTPATEEVVKNPTKEPEKVIETVIVTVEVEAEAEAEAEVPDPTATKTPEKEKEAEKIGECDAPASSYEVFEPSSSWNWTKLNNTLAPTFEEFLEMHGLTANDIQDFSPQNVSWEPSMFVIELDPSLYGKVSVPLIEGFVYTLALSDESVEVMWGGDPKVKTACLQWGLTARWVPEYMKPRYTWLDPDDPRELAAREYRFGRYLRSSDMESIRADVSYFDRYGPYYTGTGNLNVQGWIPPSLDSNVPRTFMDACAILGGLCNESEWKHGEPGGGGYLNWAWKYTNKVPNYADYCPNDMPCWQTVYPPDGIGYVEIWYDGGPVKFYAEDRAELTDGLHNVDEFSYHADPSR